MRMMGSLDCFIASFSSRAFARKLLRVFNCQTCCWVNVKLVFFLLSVVIIKFGGGSYLVLELMLAFSRVIQKFISRNMLSCT
jgi:hypothetical protein